MNTQSLRQNFIGLSLVVLSSLVAIAEIGAAERPRLFVLVVFDQMRGDYLGRWEKQFGDDGFRRLLKDGAWYQNCNYPYAGTLTGAGHASLLTGCSPSSHGIVANEWYDRGRGATVNCVGSLKHERIPAVAPMAKDRGKVSPENLKSVSFGDVLKQSTKDEARIVGLSFKDRSAVLPAGRTPDACYWFDSNSGSFVTSTYYTDQVHPWVEKFNSERIADQWFGKDWTRFRTDLKYEELSGPDDVVGEGTGKKQGRVFPHILTGGLKEPGLEFYEAVYTSPYGNDLLLALAKRAIDAEQLGADDVPDLLTISFSSNDAVGHQWGPDSQEVLDVTLRSDDIMKQLLAYLDDKVGKGKYLMALSADHGICPIPEVAKTKGKDAGRILSKEFKQHAEDYLEAHFGDSTHDKPRWISSLTNGWFYFNQATLRSEGVPQTQVVYALSNWLKQQPGIMSVYCRQKVESGVSEDDVVGQRIALSYNPDRCGDLLIVLKPYWLLGDYSTGTTHGSPFGYDSHVPLLVYGTNVVPGIRTELVPPQAIAPIFAQALGVSPPAGSITPLPNGLFVQAATR